MAPYSSTLVPDSSTPVLLNPMDGGAGRLQSMGSLSWTWLSDFTFTFHFHALEKEMATHSSVLAWRTPGTVKPGGLLSMGSNRVGHNWSDLAAAFPIVIVICSKGPVAHRTNNICSLALYRKFADPYILEIPTFFKNGSFLSLSSTWFTCWD